MHFSFVSVLVEQSTAASGVGAGAGADFSLQTGFPGFEFSHSHFPPVKPQAFSPRSLHVKSVAVHAFAEALLLLLPPL